MSTASTLLPTPISRAGMSQFTGASNMSFYGGNFPIHTGTTYYDHSTKGEIYYRRASTCPLIQSCDAHRLRAGLRAVDTARRPWSIPRFQPEIRPPKMPSGHSCLGPEEDNQ